MRLQTGSFHIRQILRPTAGSDRTARSGYGAPARLRLRAQAAVLDSPLHPPSLPLNPLVPRTP
jgi:hypothetical protein